MKRLYGEDKRENLLYLLLWIAVFVIGAVVLWLDGLSRPEGAFSFADVLRLWGRILPFLVFFLLHNFLAAPLLLRRHEPLAYGLATAGLLAAFVVYMVATRHGPGMEMRPPGPFDPGAPFGGDPFGAAPPPRGRRGGPMPMDPAVLKILLGLMMVGANLGIKALFRSARDAARVKELEAENLQQRLDTLRYQINPHFFMNTLNNIHALVDLDPAKAKESIVELSRMMRHILYDAGSPTIPLSQEIEFLQHYVALMRLRYPEGVDISLSLPESDGGAQVPPLVYASFVENAFKHGVSYAAPSFIRISVAVDGGKVLFKCANSRQEAAAQEGGSGIGLENARRRLDLLYGDRYTLHIDQDAARYELLLVLPAHPETPATA